MKILETEENFLVEAATFFTNPGKLAKGLAVLGEPIERLHNRLPEKAKEKISAATKKAIEKALEAALTTIPPTTSSSGNTKKSSDISQWLHKGSTTVTGALGGFFGLAALPVELPVTTVLILRGILDQARVFGHDIEDLETRLECLMVFAIGTPNPNDDSAETGYFAARIGLTQALKAAASYVGGSSVRQMLDALEKGLAPAVAALIAQVARAFEVRVTQKMMGEMVPVLGAVGGGAINFAFTDFYCSAAKYHFGIRSLEKKYGTAMIQQLLRDKMKAAK